MSTSLSPKPGTKPAANLAAGVAPAPAAPKMPGETVRALVSLWLIFHLFCVGLALVTNSNLEPSTSQLVGQLRNTFSPYMSVLWVDTPPDYHFTFNENADHDHVLTAEWETPDGIQTREFPSAGSRGEIRERYAALARTTAYPLYNESGDRDVIRGIGVGLINQTGAKEITFHIRRHSPLSMQDASADDPGQHDPNNKRTIAPVYTAVVSLDSNGEGQVNSLSEEKRDVAPVTNRGGVRNPGESGSGADSNADAPKAEAPKSDAPKTSPSAASRHKQADPLPPMPPKNILPLDEDLKNLLPKDDKAKQ